MKIRIRKSGEFTFAKVKTLGSFLYNPQRSIQEYLCVDYFFGLFIIEIKFKNRFIIHK